MREALDFRVCSPRPPLLELDAEGRSRASVRLSMPAAMCTLRRPEQDSDWREFFIVKRGWKRGCAMANIVGRSLSGRALTAEAFSDVNLWANKEVIPTILQMRSLLNRLASRFKSGDVDPSAAPAVAGDDGDIYVRTDGVPGAQLWIMTAGTWRAIA